MKRYLFDNFSLFTFISIIILYSSLLIGFYYNENSTGGAFIDYYAHKQISISFSNDFLNTLLNFDETKTRHSPILLILLSVFEKFQVNDLLIRFINLHFCLILPVIFYRCLKIKFYNISEKYLILLSGLIFLSPTFRSLSIWPDSRIWGLLFLCFSIYYFLLFKKKKKFSYCIYVILFYTISSYFSPNFSVFSIYFMLYFFKSLDIIKTVQLFILNLVLSFPALYYVLILDINFMFSASAVPGGIDSVNNINFFNKILIISSIVFFYLIPFLVSKSINFQFKKINFKNLIFLLVLFFISLYFFDYKFKYTGGGFFFQISNFLFNNNIFFFIVALFSLILNYVIFIKPNKNLLIIFLLILSNPQLTIYHKYYDPFLLILFLTLFDLDLIKKKLFSQKSMNIFYLFSLFFLIVSISKSYV